MLDPNGSVLLCTPMSVVVTPICRFGSPPSSVASESIIFGKLSINARCWSLIDEDVSMTNRMSMSRFGMAGRTMTSCSPPTVTSLSLQEARRRTVIAIGVRITSVPRYIGWSNDDVAQSAAIA
jgi:hypothetical protein